MNTRTQARISKRNLINKVAVQAGDLPGMATGGEMHLILQRLQAPEKGGAWCEGMWRVSSGRQGDDIWDKKLWKGGWK